MTVNSNLDLRSATKDPLGNVGARKHTGGPWRSWGLVALELLAAALLASIATYPLVAHLFGGDRPADMSQDDYVFYWNFWWVKRALIDHGTNPLFCSQIFYPYGTSLALTPLGLLYCFLALPIILLGHMPDAVFQ